MGIENLLPFLAPCTTRKPLHSYASKTVGVDAMGWLHRGAVASAFELLTGKDTDKFLTFFMRMTTLLLINGITPFIVFDGDRLPAKQQEESQRKEKRQKAKSDALTLIKESANNKENTDKIRNLAVQAISITPEMISRVMNALRQLGVKFIVAPYEADAQLGFLWVNKDIDAVIAEDSDILSYGCRKLLTKFDAKEATVMEIDLSWAFMTDFDSVSLPANLGFLGRFTSWPFERFIDLCVFAGCDYGGDVKGIGIKKAFDLLIRFQTAERVIKFLVNEKKVDSMAPAMEGFNFAKFVFLYSWVFDDHGKCKRINEIPNDRQIEVEKSTGPEIPSDLEIMHGNLDWKTGLLRNLVEFTPMEKYSVDILLAEKESILKINKKIIEEKIRANFQQKPDHQETPDFAREIELINEQFGFYEQSFNHMRSEDEEDNKENDDMAIINDAKSQEEEDFFIDLVDMEEAEGSSEQLPKNNPFAAVKKKTPRISEGSSSMTKTTSSVLLPLKRNSQIL
jgi:exonuclease 1